MSNVPWNTVPGWDVPRDYYQEDDPPDDEDHKGGWHPVDETPQSGRKIIALYSDGSGARLFVVHDSGMIDSDGEESSMHPDNFSLWAYLPDGFRLWCEDRNDDPVTF